MVITVKVENRTRSDMSLRTTVASEQPLPANASVAFTLDYTPDMGELVLVLEPA